MRRADRVGGLVLLLFAVGYSAGALRYPYWGANGPGSGFLPVWLGLGMAILALLLLVGATRRRDPGEPWLPTGQALKRLIAVLGATALFTVLLTVVGMILGVGLFMLGVLRFLEGYAWRVAVGVAVATALLTYLIFTYWLAVAFPIGALGF